MQFVNSSSEHWSSLEPPDFQALSSKKLENLKPKTAYIQYFSVKFKKKANEFYISRAMENHDPKELLTKTNIQI